MSKFKQDFSNSHLRPQYKKIDGHIVEVGKIDLQELYNSMLPNSLDSILSAFLNPVGPSTVDDTITDCSCSSFEELADEVEEFAIKNGFEDLSFSDVLLKMINPNYSSASVTATDSSTDVSNNDVSSCGGSNNE